MNKKIISIIIAAVVVCSAALGVALIRNSREDNSAENVAVSDNIDIEEDSHEEDEFEEVALDADNVDDSYEIEDPYAVDSNGREIYNRTSIIIDTAYLDPEDEDKVDLQIGDYTALIYDSEEEAAEALEKYHQSGNEEAEYGKNAWIMDDGTSSYSYLSYGPSSIASQSLADAIMDKYGKAENIPEVLVGIVDSGINYNHPLLAGRVDTDLSYDYYNSDSDAMDDNEHGTHVAGIIADTALDNVTFVAYKVADSSGSSDSVKMAKGILKAVEDEVDVINISMGGSGSDSIIDEALDKAYDAGIMVVVAAGNESDDTSGYFPASYDKCLTVSATDAYDNFVRDFSNYGDEVDLAAPGYNVNSSVLGSDYEELSGTSMATPFVTAAYALLKTYYPNYSYSQLETILKNNAVDKGTEGFDVYYGYGVVNLDGFGERAEAPVFDVKGGEYGRSVTISISSSDPDAEIYYTTDGSSPLSRNSDRILYTGPFTLTTSTMIRAASSKEESLDSRIATERYYINGASENAEFTMLRDRYDRGYITYYKGSQSIIVIPSAIGTLTTKYLYYDLFTDSQAAALTAISLPDKLTGVYSNVFSKSSNLKYVIYKSGSNADPSNLTISSGNTYFKNATWVKTSTLMVDTMPSSTVAEYGNYPDLTGGVLLLADSAGGISFVDMTDESVTITGYDPYKLGTQTVTLNCDGYTTTISVFVRGINKVELLTRPEKYYYEAYNETLDLTGGVLKVSYNDGTSENVDITKDMVKGYDKNTPGVQSLTVTYGENTVSFDVRVVEVFLEKASLSLGETVKIIFRFSFDDLTAADSNAYMLITNVEQSESDKVYISKMTKGSDGFYRIAVSVPSKEFANTIKAQLYIGDDTAGREFSYSVQDYIEMVLNPDNDEASWNSEGLISICKAIANYGGASQVYYNYNTGNNLSDSKYMEESDKSVDVDTNTLAAYRTAAEGSLKGISFVETELDPESKVISYIYFEIEEGYSADEFEFFVDDIQVIPEVVGKSVCITLSSTARNIGKTRTIRVAQAEELTATGSPDTAGGDVGEASECEVNEGGSDNIEDKAVSENPVTTKYTGNDAVGLDAQIDKLEADSQSTVNEAGSESEVAVGSESTDAAGSEKTATVAGTEVTDEITIKYSHISSVYEAVTSEDNETYTAGFKTLCKALFKYYQAVKSFFGD